MVIGLRTRKYYSSFKKVEMFCKMSSDGLIIAEINDKITVTEFIKDLSCKFNVYCIEYNDLVKSDLNLKSLFTTPEIIIVYGVIYNAKDIVTNLNYNRNWFLKLNLKIVFILPSFVVDELIEYSANFWSCVALHEKFNSEFNCIIKPRFIDTIYNSVEPIIKKNMSVNSIIFNVWGKSIYIKKGDYDILEDFLDNIYKHTDKSSILGNLNKFLKFMQLCYYNAMFKYVILCGKFILDKRDLISQFDNVDKFVFFELYANSNFYLRDYNTSLNFLNQLMQLYNDNESLFKKKSVPAYLNNLGVLLILTRNYDIALSALNIAYSDNSLYAGWILYNLSLLSYIIDDYKNASYYISEAIKHISDIDSKGYVITKETYGVLEAYIKVNLGDIVNAEKIISNNLYLLRQKLDEFQLSILEAHYVYSLVYLYKGELSKALICAQKSLQIAIALKYEEVKPCICELIGEIYYEQNIYPQAKKYLIKALKKNNNNEYFIQDVSNWIQDAIFRCNTEIHK